jgi:hypothetical protein
VFPEDLGKSKIGITYERLFYLDDEDYEIKKKLYFIKYKKWNRAKFSRKRLIVQELIEKLLADGWSLPKYPRDMLLADLVKINATNIDEKHFIRSGWLVGLSNAPGKYLIQHFSDWAEKTKEMWNARQLYRAIRRLLLNKKNVSRMRIFHLLNRYAYPNNNRFITPNVYRGIFRQLKLVGRSIADPYPSSSKAIASVIEGCSYFTPTVNEPLMKFLGTTKFGVTGETKYDCVILDGDFRHSVNLEDVKKWRPFAKTMLVYVKREDINNYPQPTKKICIYQTNAFEIPEDYLYVFKR